MLALIWHFAICLIIISKKNANAWRSDKTIIRTWGQQTQQHHLEVTLTLKGGADSNHSDGDDDDVPVVFPLIDRPPVMAKKKKALILLDTFCPYHGIFLANRAKIIYGVTVIPVFSDYMKGYFTLQQPDDLERLLSMCMPSEKDRDDWCRPLRGYELVAVVCESDSGLADAERLGVLLNTTYNNGFNEARRNKYLMIEQLQKAGLQVVKQRLCETVDEACSFAKELGIDSEPESCIVVKPVRGVGSEDVFLCRDMDSIKSAFEKIHGETVFGSPKEKHQAVLVQEFAVGQEFALDIVSRNGEHKVAAVWVYDKRPANGASFVYYATKLYDGPHMEEICEHVRKSLDALDIQWGVTHSEVILSADGPRLVEVNCRQHNMDFIPLTMECIGYNVFDMLLAAYLGGEDPFVYPMETEEDRLNWELLPLNPSIRMNGAMIHIVNYANGTLTNVNEEALREIQKMRSVMNMEVYPPFLHIGNKILPTVDIRTDAGWVQMVNPDQEEFQKDYDRIIELMPVLFKTEEES